MSYIYARNKRAERSAPYSGNTPAQPSLEELRSGAAVPTAAQTGHRVDLPDAMREKMEAAFGADLSAVKLYESEAVAEAGAKAVTRGSDIAFAPGMLDFTSFGGQALLGHELSHVVSQARGEVTGGGFLHDAALETRADREGAMAAAGETVSMPYSALSPVSAADAAGPMQASKASDKLVNAGALTPDMIRNAKLKDLRRKDVQDRVLRDYIAELNSDIVASNGEDRTSAKNNFRDNSGLSKKVYNEMLSRLAEPYIQKMEKKTMGMEGLERVNAAGNMMADAVEQDASLSHMIAGAKAAFAGSTHFTDDTTQGELLMNNFMLRGVTPHSANLSTITKSSEKAAALRNYSRDLQRATNQNMTGVDTARMAHDTVLSGSAGMQRLLGTAQRLWARGDDQAPGEVQQVYKPYQVLDPSKAGKVNRSTPVYELTNSSAERDKATARKDKAGLAQRLSEKYRGRQYKPDSMGDISDENGFRINGLRLDRMLPRMEQSLGEDFPEEYIDEMYKNLMAPHLTGSDSSPQAAQEASHSFDKGMGQLKKIQYAKLKRMEATYGKLGTQMHPEDFLRLAGDGYEDHFHEVQDAIQLLNGGGRYFDFEHSEEDRDFRKLATYYTELASQNVSYSQSINQEENGPNGGTPFDARFFDRLLARNSRITPELESSIQGPSLTPEQQTAYTADVQRRAEKSKKAHRLFGRFRKSEGAG